MIKKEVLPTIVQFTDVGMKLFTIAFSYCLIQFSRLGISVCEQEILTFEIIDLCGAREFFLINLYIIRD